MIVYGDLRRVEETSAALRRVRARAERLRAPLPPEERQPLLTGLLIDAGEVVQGILDALFSRAEGRDATSRAATHGHRLVQQIAAACYRAWANGGLSYELPDVSALAALESEPLPGRITVTAPEGFVHYAVLPELYFAAGRRFRAAHGSSVRVIGIRSIGTTLAACVAAGVGAPRPAITVRPTGHPFERRLSIAPDLTEQILGHEEWYAVVDEGPGLSGSSLFSVADWLEYRGVRRDRIVFFPSHGGEPGARADAARLGRWRGSERFHVPFEEVMLAGEGLSPLARLFSDVTGGEPELIEDVGAGGWRRRLFSSSALWPAADTRRERRKYLLASGSQRWLLKFAGLGRYGEEKLERARVLARAGFTPPPVALRSGFLLSEWVPGRPAEPGPVPAALLDTIGEYLSTLWFRFPARPEEGAGPEKLLEMAFQNASEGLNGEIARELLVFQDRVGDLSRRARPVRTDNRMRPVEWIRGADGRYLKTDALDHHASHDLVGPQDLSWDLAGTILEFHLDEKQGTDLLSRVQQRTGWHPTAEQMAFALRCYAAFRLGEDTLASQALSDADPDEASRLHASARRWALTLRKLLASPVNDVLNRSSSARRLRRVAAAT